MRVRLTVVAGIATLLGSVCLYPFFESSGWLWTGLATIISVAVAGLIARRLRLPPAVGLLAGVIAILLCLNLLYAHHQSLLWIIPTPQSVHRLRTLISAGWHDIGSYAAPVPLLPGITLLTGLGIGLVALLVDFLAVRLRRAAAAGLPLLAMYSIPAEVRQQSVHWIAFLVGAAGFLALLLTDSREQLSTWGRPVFTRRWSNNAAIRERPDSSTLGISGRRIGLTAVVVAVLIPVATPGLDPHSIFGGGKGGIGHGGGSVISPANPMVSLRETLLQTDNATVLTYHSTEPSPDYLQTYVLDQFNGQDWTYTPFRGDRTTALKGNAFPAPQGVSATTTRLVTTKVKIDSHVDNMNVLPAPYQPVKVSIKGNWRVDGPTLMVYSAHDSAGGRGYTVQSRRLVPSAAQLEMAGPPALQVMASDLALPDNFPARYFHLAQQVTHTGATPYDKAVLLEQWFLKPGNFTYSLHPPLKLGDTNAADAGSTGALGNFLFVSKTGYCQQFAASMAVLARTLGIPARVAVGYTQGTRGSSGDWVVRDSDSHAWPELYFQGVGWIRFEPTPAGFGGQGTADVPAYAQPNAASTTVNPGQIVPPDSTVQPGASSSPGSTLGRHRTDPGQKNTVTSTTSANRGHGVTPLAWILALLILVLILSVPLAMHAVTRRRRWGRVRRVVPPAGPRRPEDSQRTGSDDREIAHAAWEETRDTVLDLGLSWRPSDTPRAAARRLAETANLDADAAAALDRLATAEELARYARSPGPAETLRADARSVRTALFATVDRSARLRALLVPPSSVSMLKDTAAHALDMFARLDHAGARARDRLMSLRSR